MKKREILDVRSEREESDVRMELEFGPGFPFLVAKQSIPYFCWKRDRYQSGLPNFDSIIPPLDPVALIGGSYQRL